MHGYLCIYIRIFKVLLCICFIPGVCLRVCVLGWFRTPCYLCTCLCRASGFAQNFNLILSNEKDKKISDGRAGGASDGSELRDQFNSFPPGVVFSSDPDIPPLVSPVSSRSHL